jgi:hypothetical protein
MRKLAVFILALTLAFGLGFGRAQTSVYGGNAQSSTQGTSVNWRSAWSVSTSYAINDAVSFGGSSYIAILAGTGHEPDSSPTYWGLLAQAGSMGAAGSAGAAGAAGPNTLSTSTSTPINALLKGNGLNVAPAVSGTDYDAPGAAAAAQAASLQKTNNLSDLASASAARTSLGLGTAATQAASYFQAALGFTPYNATNPAGYITSSALTPYLLSSGFTSAAVQAMLGSSVYDAYGSALTVTIPTTGTGNQIVTDSMHTESFAMGDTFDLYLYQASGSNPYISSCSVEVD